MARARGRVGSRDENRSISHIDEQIKEIESKSFSESPIDSYIIEIINNNPGHPSFQVMAGIIEKLSTVEDFSGDINAVHGLIRERLDAISGEGLITRLEVRSASVGFRETLYYPRDFRFTVTPRNMIEASGPRGRDALTPLVGKNREAAEHLLYILDNANPRIRLEAVYRYCPYCGEINEGHYCRAGQFS